MPQRKRAPVRPANEIEKQAVQDEIDGGLQAGVDKLSGKDRHTVDSFHNTKRLLQQYRRVAYAISVSESELNLRMEMEHGVSLSNLEVNAELAGVDLSGTKLEGYTRSVIRSKNMLEVINTAMDALRANPDRGELMYHVLHETYFTPQKPENREQILAALDAVGYAMSISSYHNYLNAAIHALDRILWGYTARDCINIIRQFLPE